MTTDFGSLSATKLETELNTPPKAETSSVRDRSLPRVVPDKVSAFLPGAELEAWNVGISLHSIRTRSSMSECSKRTAFTCGATCGALMVVDALRGLLSAASLLANEMIRSVPSITTEYFACSSNVTNKRVV